MGSVALAAERLVDASPEEVFDLFGVGTGVFGAQCDRVAVGSPVTVQVPLAGTGREDIVQILGRIVAARRGHKIVIAHDLPWRGRLRCLFDPEDGGRTRVRLIAEVDPDGLGWLLRYRGWPVEEEPDDGTHRIGLLTSKSGPGGVYAITAEHMARLAVEEINADGGLAGRTVRLLVGDDATDEAVGAAEALRLASAGCRVLVACVTSATFQRVEAALAGSGTLLVHPVVNEGGPGHERLFRLGERPSDQLRATVRPLMRATGARRWFLVGNDYCWSHGAHASGRREIAARGGGVVGEALRPLGTREFRPLIDEVARSGAELILSTLVGADEVAFERQSHELGLRGICRTLALVLDESTRERIGDEAACGITTAFGYFQQLPTQANLKFLERYRARFGRHAAPVSSICESVYEAVHLYARAAHFGDDDVVEVGRRLRRLDLELPRGRVVLDGPTTLRQPVMMPAEATVGGYRIEQSGH
jgi:urea transport system substrate-binding protein